jgi:hypothetical protein
MLGRQAHAYGKIGNSPTEMLDVTTDQRQIIVSIIEHAVSPRLAAVPIYPA